MDSLEYWQKREQDNRNKIIRDEAEYAKRIREILDQTTDRMQQQIDSWYMKYAKEEGITMAEAKRRCDQLDIDEYGRLAKQYIATHDFSPQANADMRIYNLTMKVNRLEMIKSRIGLELTAGYADVNSYLDRALTDQALAEFQRQAGILGLTVGSPEKRAHAIVNGSYQRLTFRNGKGTWPTFSDNLWAQKQGLKSTLDTELATGIIRGMNPTTIAGTLYPHMRADVKNRKYVAERLMRTEMRRVQTEVQKQSFERNGYDEYMFIAEPSCCPECATLNGQHFYVRDMQPGMNAPPMHPNCRCSTAAYMDPDRFNAWLDSGAARNGVAFEDFNL